MEPLLSDTGSGTNLNAAGPASGKTFEDLLNQALAEGSSGGIVLGNVRDRTLMRKGSGGKLGETKASAPTTPASKNGTTSSSCSLPALDIDSKAEDCFSTATSAADHQSTVDAAPPTTPQPGVEGPEPQVSQEVHETSRSSPRENHAPPCGLDCAVKPGPPTPLDSGGRFARATGSPLPVPQLGEGQRKRQHESFEEAENLASVCRETMDEAGTSTDNLPDNTGANAAMKKGIPGLELKSDENLSLQFPRSQLDPNMTEEADDVDPAKLSLKLRLESKRIQHRIHGLEELTMLVQRDADSRDEVFNSYLRPHLRKFLRDASVPGLAASLKLLTAYVSSLALDRSPSVHHTERARELWGMSLDLLVEKGLSNVKTHEEVYNLVASLVEMGGSVEIAELIVDSLLSHVSKIMDSKKGNVAQIKGGPGKSLGGICQCLHCLVHDFGNPVILAGKGCKSFSSSMLKLAFSTDKTIKEGALGVIISLVRYSSNPAFAEFVLDSVKDSKLLQTELKSRLDKALANGQLRPSRHFRQPGIATNVSPTSKLASRRACEEEDDVLKDVCLNKGWEKRVTDGVEDTDSKKEPPWKVKQVAWMELESGLKKAFSINTRNSFIGTVVAHLTRNLKMETILPIVGVCLRVSGLLAQKWEKMFQPHARTLVPLVMAKLKDTNKMILHAAMDCMDSFLAVCPIDVIVSEAQVLLKDKNSNVRQQALELLLKAVDHPSQVSFVSKASSSLANIGKTCLDDGSSSVRATAARLLAAAATFDDADGTVQSVISSLPDAKKKLLAQRGKGKHRSAQPSTNTERQTKTPVTCGMGRDRPSEIDPTSTSPPSPSKAPRSTQKAHGSSEMADCASSVAGVSRKPQPAASPYVGEHDDEVPESAISEEEATEVSRGILPPTLFALLSSETIPDRVEGLRSVICWWGGNPELASSKTEHLIRFLFFRTGEFRERTTVLQKCILDFFEELLVLAKASLTGTCVGIMLPPFLDRLGDLKIGSRLTNIILGLGEIVGPAVVASLLIRVNGESSKPKTVEETFKHLEILICEFGATSFPTKPMVYMSKRNLDVKHKGCRNGAMGLLALLIRAKGEKHIFSLLDGAATEEVKHLLKTLSLKVPQCSFPRPRRDLRSSLGVGGEGSTSGVSIEASPQTSIASFLSSDLFARMNDAQWAVRLSALESVISVLQSKVDGGIRPDGVSELVMQLRRRIFDANKAVSKLAVDALSLLADCLGPYAIRFSKTVLQALLDKLADKDSKAREAASDACWKWMRRVKAPGFVSVSLLSLGDSSRTEVREQVLKMLLSEDLDLQEANDNQLLGAVRPLIDCLLDRTKRIRTLAEQCLERFWPFLGEHAYGRIMHELKAPQAETVAAVLLRLAGSEKGHQDAGGQRSNSFSPTPSLTPDIDDQPSLAADPEKASQAATPPREGRNCGSGKLPKNGNTVRLPGRRASSAGQRLQSKLGSAVREISDDPQYFIRANQPPTCASKSQREERAKSIRWPLEVQGNVLEQLQMDLRPHVSEQLLSAMFDKSSFQSSLRAYDTWMAFIDQEENAGRITGEVGLIDLLLKWITIKLGEANMKVLLGALELARYLLKILSERSEMLTDYELQIICPSVMERVGHNNRDVRLRLRDLLDQLAAVSDSSRFFNLLFKALSSSNKRTIAEILDAIGRTIRSCHSKAFPAVQREVPRIASFYQDVKNDRDVRAAALRALAWMTVSSRSTSLLSDLSAETRKKAEDAVKQLSATAKGSSSSADDLTLQALNSWGGAKLLPEDSTSDPAVQGEEKGRDITSGTPQPDCSIQDATSRSEAATFLLARRNDRQELAKRIEATSRDLEELFSGEPFTPVLKDIKIASNQVDAFLSKAQSDRKEQIMRCHHFLGVSNHDLTKQREFDDAFMKATIASLSMFRTSESLIIAESLLMRSLCQTLESGELSDMSKAAKYLMPAFQYAGATQKPSTTPVSEATLTSTQVFARLGRALSEALDSLFQPDNFRDYQRTCSSFQAIIHVLQLTSLYLKKRIYFTKLGLATQRELCKTLLCCMSRYQAFIHRSPFVHESDELIVLRAVITAILNQCVGKDLLGGPALSWILLMEFILGFSLDVIDGKLTDMNSDTMWRFLGKVHKKCQAKLGASRDAGHLDEVLFVKLTNSVMASLHRLQSHAVNCHSNQEQGEHGGVTAQQIGSHISYIRLFLSTLIHIGPQIVGKYFRDMGYGDDDAVCEGLDAFLTGGFITRLPSSLRDKSVETVASAKINPQADEILRFSSTRKLISLAHDSKGEDIRKICSFNGSLAGALGDVTFPAPILQKLSKKLEMSTHSFNARQTRDRSARLQLRRLSVPCVSRTPQTPYDTTEILSENFFVSDCWTKLSSFFEQNGCRKDYCSVDDQLDVAQLAAQYKTETLDCVKSRRTQLQGESRISRSIAQ